jgi:hypothetical protein
MSFPLMKFGMPIIRMGGGRVNLWSVEDHDTGSQQGTGCPRLPRHVRATPSGRLGN